MTQKAAEWEQEPTSRSIKFRGKRSLRVRAILSRRQVSMWLHSQLGSQPLGDSTEDQVNAPYYHLRPLCFDFCFYTRVGSPRDRIPHVSESSSPFLVSTSDPHCVWGSSSFTALRRGARGWAAIHYRVSLQWTFGHSWLWFTGHYHHLRSCSFYLGASCGWMEYRGSGTGRWGFSVHIYSNTAPQPPPTNTPQQQHNITMNHRLGIIIREFCWGSVVVNCGRL